MHACKQLEFKGLGVKLAQSSTRAPVGRNMEQKQLENDDEMGDRKGIIACGGRKTRKELMVSLAQPRNTL